MRSKRGFILFLILIFLLAFFPQVCVFLFPGLFILLADNKVLHDEDDFLKTLANTVIFSLAFWVVSYWISRESHIKMTSLFYACNFVFVALFGWYSRKEDPAKISFNTKEDSILILLFLLLCLARLAPYLCRITGSTGDMSQHNDMIKIIMLNNGTADSYEPIMPFKHFGEYPLGFHTLCALISLLGGSEFYRISNFMSSIAFLLLHLSLYVFLRKYFSKILSLSVSVPVLALSHYPQFLNQWGSSPTALSSAFLFFFWGFLMDIWEGGTIFSRVEKIGIAAVGASGFLTHLLPPIGFLFYFSAFILLGKLMKQGSFRALFGHWEIFLFSLLFCLPFLFNFNFAVFQSSKSALIQGHENSFFKIVSILKTPLSFPLASLAGPWIEFCFVFGPVFTLLSIGSAIYLWLISERLYFLVQYLGACLLFFAIVSVFSHRLVFFYHLLQSERIHYFLLIPASSMIAAALLSASARVSKPWLAGLIVSFLFFTAWNALRSRRMGFESHYTTFKNDKKLLPFLASDCLLGSYFSYAFDKVNSYCSPADLSAFGWIRKNIPLDSVFLVNDGDGGPLLPSIAERKITSPHGMDLWHSRELREWQNNHSPAYIYIGKNNSPKYPPEYRRTDLEREPSNYENIYDRDGVSMFKILPNHACSTK